MENFVIQERKNNSRIGSIDAVRAIVLLGILVVHTLGGFGFQLDFIKDSFDSIVNLGISKFLVNKCAVVFNVLFGVSFYFILKKPQYSSWKFAWRCFILFGFGLINKLLYTYDALCWYAIWGIVLVCFRKCKPVTLLYFAIILKLFAHLLSPFDIGNMMFGNSSIDRYDLNNSFISILSYPYALIDYLRIVCNGGILGCLSNFLLGYAIACAGIIDKLNKLITVRTVCAAIGLLIALFSAYWHGRKPSYYNLLFGLSYAIGIIYLYNTKLCHPILHYLECYGRLGLTNYSMQSIFGVSLVYCTRNTIIVQHLWMLLCVMLCFYILQAVFSHWWLSTHKFGPMEYIWRSLTDRKFKGNRIVSIN